MGVINAGRRLGVRHDAAVQHLDSPISYLCHGRVVRDEHDRGGALGTQPFEKGEDGADGSRVETSGRFVGQEHAGIVRHGAGYGDPLSFAPGELGGVPMGQRSKSNFPEQL